MTTERIDTDISAIRNRDCRECCCGGQQEQNNEILIFYSHSVFPDLTIDLFIKIAHAEFVA